MAAMFSSMILINIPFAHAGTNCSFTVTNTQVHPDGDIEVAFVNGATSRQWRLCNLGNNTIVNDGTGNITVTPQACQGSLSLLITARAAAIPTTLYYYANLANCTTSLPPSFGIPNPVPYSVILGN